MPAALPKPIQVSRLMLAVENPAKRGKTGREKLARLLEALASPTATFLETATLLGPGERAQVYEPSFREAVARGTPLAERIAAKLARRRPLGPRRITDQLLGLDLACWLPNNILMKLDRLTMAHGLEGRVPFLDRALVEHALGSPWKGPPRPTKVLLRRAMANRLPPAIARQKKQSFYFPIEESLGPAYEKLVREVLDPDAVKRRGILAPAWIEALVARGSGRELVESKRLFAALALEIWLREVVDREPAPVPLEVARAVSPLLA